MEEPTHPQAAPSVLAFILPGVGHYLPIASLLLELDPPGGVVVAAEASDDNPVWDRIAADGFTPVVIPSLAGSTRAAPALRALSRLLRISLAPRIATLGRHPIGLPTVPARLAFALGAQVLPIPHTSAAAGRAVNAIIDDARPALIVAEYDSPWFELIAAERQIPFVRYTTGPVGTVEAGRPVGPAGFAPGLPGLERAANAINRQARLLRRRRSDRAWRRSRTQHLGGAAPPPQEPVASVSFSARTLDAYRSEPQREYDYVGASLHRPVGPVGPDGDRDTILVTWGSRPSAADSSVLARLAPALALRTATQRVVIQTGDRGLQDRLRATSSAFVVLDPTPAPLWEEYRRAQLVIGAGGYGTIIESLCFGAPVLTVPLLAADRLETAQRLIQSGAGLTLDRYTFATADAATAIGRLIDEPSFAERARAVGADLRDRTARDRLLDDLRTALSPPATP